MLPSTSSNSDKPSERGFPAEVNIESIRALEEQIREHEKAIIKLKRARNSLLNVSKLPPETLGEIFRHNATLKTDFGRLGEGSYNFLLVCHHWFEVASSTPHLWGFWGNNLQDWMKRHLQHPTAPLDLVFNGMGSDTLNDSLRNALQDRATRDAIRRIHLAADDPDILNSILSPLALTGCQGIQSCSVESVIVRCESMDVLPVVLDFLAHYHFPKLRRLELEYCIIPSWDLVVSKSPALTTLILDSKYPSPTITTSQILSILHSNPSLREVTLRGCAIPDDGQGETFRVLLPHLRELGLTGHPQGVLTVLQQLEYPRNMATLILGFMDITVEDISRIIGPYLREYLGRRRNSDSGLGLRLSSSEYTIQFLVGDVRKPGFYAPILAWVDTSVAITIYKSPPMGLTEEDLLDLVTCVPREQVTYCRVQGSPIFTEVMSAQLPYLRMIHFEYTPLHVSFPKPNLDWNEIFPSIQYIHISLYQEAEHHTDWESLTTFLDHLISFWNRLDTLEIDGLYDMYPEVEERIRRAVRELRMT